MASTESRDILGPVAAGDIILGAGVTGLAAGLTSGLDIYEAAEHPGGICSSYYVRPGSKERLHDAPADGEAYRFEIGGGHWIFGGDPKVLEFIQSLAPCTSYGRVSSVFLPDRKSFVPYPIQNHLRFLDAATVKAALAEMRSGQSFKATANTTMAQWLSAVFGPTLGREFFDGFHALYTAGLHTTIAPQDAYKSPVDLKIVERGATADAPAVGYNTKYLYPDEGLNVFTKRLAAKCRVNYGKRATRIDHADKTVTFADGSSRRFDRVLSTLPLDKTLAMAGLSVDVPADPYTSVLVLNIGAARGKQARDDHWIYVPSSESGFHRVGFYNNVSPAFLPKSSRDKGNRVSVYVERAYRGGQKPTQQQVDAFVRATIAELQSWGWIGEVEVADPTWIETAYTWSWPNSPWREKAMATLENAGIVPVGRYARWIFQGIADSLRDGFAAGERFKQGSP